MRRDRCELHRATKEGTLMHTRHEQRWRSMTIVTGIAALALCGAGVAQERSPPSDAAGRVVVLGFDGMDPVLAKRWMDEGKLPNFSRLAATGRFAPLGTTNPPQSPVAWSSFATGHNPGEHGVFDFLRPDVATYAPEYSIAQAEGEAHVDLFGVRIPYGGGGVVNQRVGEPFWSRAERNGIKTAVQRIPVTYPPDDVTRMLAGMGVPDLLGTQGTFTYYGTRANESENGRYVQIAVAGGRVQTHLDGPDHPFLVEPTPLSVSLELIDAGDGRVRVELDGTEVTLARGDWSEWVPVRFKILALFGVPALVRLNLVSGFPEPELYVTPLQLDPREPAAPISSPAGYAADLAERIGLYHTIGMPQETWSMNEGLMTDEAFLDLLKDVLAEREAMFFDELAQTDTRLVIGMFEQTDVVSHMFYRGFDPQHPRYSTASPLARGAIEWVYGEADRILGRVLDTLSPRDRLIVISDHGFQSFRRGLHLNSWLAANGFMVLKPDAEPSEELFGGVVWTRTKAYALGLNGLYLNLQDREALGIVPAAEVGALKRSIAEKLESLVDPVTGERVVLRVYDGAEIYQGGEMEHAPDLVIGYAAGYRASWETTLGGVPRGLIEDNTRAWSGDHCIDPSQVPGVLFTSWAFDQQVQSIQDIPSLVESAFSAMGSELPLTDGPSVRR
jgi:predicted AlkP superfamily phosphohydrolase/phosphomutase